MKKIFLKVIPFFALIILCAKISNWFLNFSNTTNSIINSLMFTLIGISYLIFSFSLENKLNRVVLVICGLFLIICNFLPETNYLSIAGIFAIIIPMLIGKFSKVTKETLNT